MKRFFAAFAVILVLTSSVCVPSSAGFAAGVDPDGDDLVLAPGDSTLWNSVPQGTSGGSSVVDLSAFFDHGVLYEYLDTDFETFRAGCSLYTPSSSSPAVYSCMVLGSTLNNAFGTYLNPHPYTDTSAYPVAFSLYENAEYGRISVANSGAFVNYNTRNVTPVGECVCSSAFPSDGDPLVYCQVIPVNSFNSDFIFDSDRFSCSSSIFTSLYDVYDAIVGYEPSPSPVSCSVTITIPAGHVAVIKSSNFEIVARTTQVIAGNASEGMPYTNQLYGYFSSLPSQFNQNSFPFGVLWEPVGPYDSSGWTKSAQWEESKGSIGIDSEPYIAICNPMYCFSRGREDPYFMTLNNTVYLTVNGVIENIWDVPLRTYITQAAGSAAQAAGNSDAGVIYEGVWDSSIPNSPVTYQNSAGETFTPQAGGLTVTDPETDFFGSLSAFFESFTSIFTWGHNAILSIIDGSRDFFAAFTGIFSWMPTEVLSVLSACLILVIVIGVVKVLL